MNKIKLLKKTEKKIGQNLITIDEVRVQRL